jgi:hypothetical protein
MATSYKKGDNWTWAFRTPGEYAKNQKKTVGSSNERMHASVRERWVKMGTDWRPGALAGFEPEERDGRWVWVKKDKAGKEVLTMEEEPFDPVEGSFEWRLRYEPIKPSAKR